MLISKNRKAQFGPDALIGLVLVAVLGLGGVFFLNMFVNGLALHGLLSVLDSEIDQRCFFILLPLTGDEYSRTGDNITGKPNFEKMSKFFGGESQYSYISFEFNNTIEVFKASIKNKFITNMTYINGYIASETKAAELRAGTLAAMESETDPIVLTSFCSLPIYSPVGKIGTADLFISES